MAEDERARVMRNIMRRIKKYDVPGLGKSQEAWMLTTKAHDALIAAVDAWHTNDNPITKQDVRIAADAFVQSWRMASELYKKNNNIQ